MDFQGGNLPLSVILYDGNCKEMLYSSTAGFGFASVLSLRPRPGIIRGTRVGRISVVCGHEAGWRRRGSTNRYPQVSDDRSRNQYRNARLPIAAVWADVGSRPRTGHGGERRPAVRSRNSSDRYWRPLPGSQPRVPADGLSPIKRKNKRSPVV